MVYAGFWKRYIASLLDLIFLIIPYAALYYVLPNLGPVLVSLLYFPIFDCSPLQATPGKYCFGLKVVQENGDRLTFSRALARYLLKIPSSFFFLGYLIQPFTAKRQTFHDLVTKAVVIHHPFSAPVDWFDLWWTQMRYVLRMQEALPADRPDSYKAGSANEAHTTVQATPSSETSAAARDEAVTAIEKLHDLFKNGILTEDEFQAKKAELLKKM